MARKRIIETEEGIQGLAAVVEFDGMQRGFRDRGILETGAIIDSGIDGGRVLELGPGPGYLGLEWLKSTGESTLIAVEISPEMIRMAEMNRREYRLENRAEYRQGNAMALPLDDASVDHVFSNGSLHEWANPDAVIAEAFRVLKPGGRLFVSDLKRNLNPVVQMMMRLLTKGAVMKAGLMSSVRAAYLPDEIRCLMERGPFGEFEVSSGAFGLVIRGRKLD